MPVKKTAHITAPDIAAIEKLDAAGIDYKAVRYNTFHVICRKNSKAVRYFPFTGKWHLYTGRNKCKCYQGTTEDFITWLLRPPIIPGISSSL